MIKKNRMNIPSIFLFIMICTVLTTYAQSNVKSKDGVTISYSVKGSGNVALVFVHGWNFDKSMWEPQVKLLADKYKVVTLDLAGHGKSGKTRKNYTVELFGYDVAAVVNTLKLSKVILVGHSLAGAVILEAYKLLKPKVIGLIGVEVYQKLDQGEPADRAEKYLTTFKDNFEGSIKAYTETILDTTASPQLVDKIVKIAKSGPKEMGISILRNLYQYNYIKAFKDVSVPVITINGSKFQVDIQHNKKYIKSNYAVKIVPKAGHFVMYERPDKFNALLREAIQELTK